mmetsp:Transcript_7949/g.15932  ORF Transcript_7949/g.15932 Transcript_7949/m.15932 type:complete len:236 (+) Transcript_7949:552-1259(+)
MSVAAQHRAQHVTQHVRRLLRLQPAAALLEPLLQRAARAVLLDEVERVLAAVVAVQPHDIWVRAHRHQRLDLAKQPFPLLLSGALLTVHRLDCADQAGRTVSCLAHRTEAASAHESEHLVVGMQLCLTALAAQQAGPLRLDALERGTLLGLLRLGEAEQARQRAERVHKVPAKVVHATSGRLLRRVGGVTARVERDGRTRAGHERRHTNLGTRARPGRTEHGTHSEAGPPSHTAG